MMAFLIFIFILTIYEIVIIFETRKQDRIKLLIIYIVFLIFCIIVGLYYINNKYGPGLATYLLKLLKIDQ